MKLAVIGATGAVGREMLLDLSALDGIDVTAFASRRSAGKTIEFSTASLTIEEFLPDKLEGFDVALMSAGGSFSKEFSPRIVEQGCTVIDNSSAWRLAPQVPLVVPEVNGDRLDNWRRPGIIANPNCSTIQMVVALKPLRDAFGLKSVHVATYQSVSGSGQKGIRELADQVGQQLRFENLQPSFYDQPIGFNVLPAIDVLDNEGHCREELKMVLETRKILRQEDLPVFAHTARVPTYNCHCEALTVELAEAVDINAAKAAFRESEGITFYGDADHAGFPTPLSVTGRTDVHVCRARLPHNEKRSAWLQFWIVADNLKKGAATNAVQILQAIGLE